MHMSTAPPQLLIQVSVELLREPVGVLALGASPRQCHPVATPWRLLGGQVPKKEPSSLKCEFELKRRQGGLWIWTLHGGFRDEQAMAETLRCTAVPNDAEQRLRWMAVNTLSMEPVSLQVGLTKSKNTGATKGLNGNTLDTS